MKAKTKPLRCVKKRKGEETEMKKKLWGLYAPVYEWAMRLDWKVYQ